MKKVAKSIFTLTLALAVSLVLAGGASAAQGGNKVWVYPDVDGDQFGDMYNGVYTNKPGDYPDYISNGTDCDDNDGAVYPTAPELCDGLATDCNNPDWPALPVYEVDDDGDGFVECVLDGGGWFGDPVTGGRDCDDAWLECYPGAAACECTVVNPVTSAGQVWMDRNLGAPRAATSSADSEAYGDRYQWGRGADGHQKSTSAVTYTSSSTDDPGHGDFISLSDWRIPYNDNLWQGVSGINNPCPSGYRIPTQAEWNIETASWSAANSAGAFASPLKLTVTGYRTAYTPIEAGNYGYYKSSTVSPLYDYMAMGLAFGPTWGHAGYHVNRGHGNSVRCIMD